MRGDKTMGDITMQKIMLENAVLKMTGTHKPVNTAQVVRALDDYSHLLDYEDDGTINGKSVERAIRKLAEAEPNLFVVVEGGEGNEDLGGGGFKGKGPGGGIPPAEAAEKFAAKKRAALEMIGIKTEK